MGKQASDQVNVDAILDEEDGSGLYTGKQAALHLAIISLRANEALNLLGQKINPNNVVGQQSYIAYAMNRHVNSRDLAKQPDRLATSEQICFALLEHGARLGHVPLDNKGTPPALRDTNLWHKPVFAAQVMFRAMDYAMAHDRPIPYLSINNLYSTLDAANPTRAAEHALKAFEDVANVQRQVVSWLDKPVDELTIRVTKNLPAESRNFWHDAVAAAGKPIGELRF